MRRRRYVQPSDLERTQTTVQVLQSLVASDGGGGNKVIVPVNFGASFTDKASAIVTGQAWVTSTSAIAAQVLTPTGVDPDELYLLGFEPVVSALVPGVGFTVTVYSQAEAAGTYNVMCQGV